MSEFWQRVAVAGGVVLVTLVLARLVDSMLGKRLELRPETRTRYRVIRRSVVVTILTVGVFSALLVIPPVRAVAGTILASSAVIDSGGSGRNAIAAVILSGDSCPA